LLIIIFMPHIALFHCIPHSYLCQPSSKTYAKAQTHSQSNPAVRVGQKLPISCLLAARSQCQLLLPKRHSSSFQSVTHPNRSLFSSYVLFIYLFRLSICIDNKRFRFLKSLIKAIAKLVLPRPCKVDTEFCLKSPPCR